VNHGKTECERVSKLEWMCVRERERSGKVGEKEREIDKISDYLLRSFV